MKSEAKNRTQQFLAVWSSFFLQWGQNIYKFEFELWYLLQVHEKLSNFDSVKDWNGNTKYLVKWYMQYPIIRNSHIRYASEIWGNFKKWLTGQDFLAKKHFFSIQTRKKRLNSSTFKISSSFEQKPNFTHQNGHSA